MVRLLETEQLDQQFAGIPCAKTLSFVDPNRMVVAGCSFGGIQSLLAAERGRVLTRPAVTTSFADSLWKGDVHQAVAMYMTDFPSSYAVVVEVKCDIKPISVAAKFSAVCAKAHWE